jgi:glycosyltransferase involved in cell wall biosynthesis
MTSAPKVSLVLACYNEEETLAASFAEILETLRELGRSYEVIFVDDVSRDRTREILKALVAKHPDVDIRVVLHEANRGRGATVTDGFRAARGEITGFLDVDLEVHSRYIPSLVREIEKGADVATVRRIYAFQLGSIDRYVMSRGYSFLVRRLLGVSVRDTETGYKFFRREALLPVLDAVQDPGWFWDTEFMVRAARRGLRIVEIPGAYIRRYDKTSTVSGVRDSLRYFGKLLAFRKALRGGAA